MNLFDRKKDLIFRIANMVLVIWLVIGMVLFWSQLTRVLLKEQRLGYELYSYRNCRYYDENDIHMCEDDYEIYKHYYDENNSDDLKQLFMFIGNIAIVSSVIYFMNRRKK